MKTTFFKTRKAIDKAAKEMDEFAKVTTVTCGHGESQGYYINAAEKLVLCESCYKEAANIQRGE